MRNLLNIHYNIEIFTSQYQAVLQYSNFPASSLPATIQDLPVPVTKCSIVS